MVDERAAITPATPRVFSCQDSPPASSRSISASRPGLASIRSAPRTRRFQLLLHVDERRIGFKKPDMDGHGADEVHPPEPERHLRRTRRGLELLRLGRPDLFFNSYEAQSMSGFGVSDSVNSVVGILPTSPGRTSSRAWTPCPSHRRARQCGLDGGSTSEPGWIPYRREMGPDGRSPLFQLPGPGSQLGVDPGDVYGHSGLHGQLAVHGGKRRLCGRAYDPDHRLPFVPQVRRRGQIDLNEKVRARDGRGDLDPGGFHGGPRDGRTTRSSPTKNAPPGTGSKSGSSPLRWAQAAGTRRSPAPAPPRTTRASPHPTPSPSSPPPPSTPADGARIS